MPQSMMTGLATAAETRALAGRHENVAFSTLGSTGLSVSQAGFGGYRITHEVETHAAALQRALKAGVNLIDTSTNYADGGSETLVGRTLALLGSSGELSRGEIVIVSKAGYLQGANYRLSRQRKQEGRPFKDLVEFGEGLEHCIHPEFLADQLDRSLQRLGLATLDVFLLHNPEYYLESAHRQGLSLADARSEYERRIRQAFEYLQGEVEKGRIGCYGVSSNTLPGAPEDPEFTSLAALQEAAESVSPSHRFRVVQLPFNLLENGAALKANQPGSKTVFQWARENGIGVLTNRPLNAFTGSRLVRLADIEAVRRQDTDEIIQKIRAVGKSEARLWKQLLPALGVPQGLQARVKQQISIADTITHHWRNFGSYERWRQIRSANFQPRVQGVVDFLAAYADENPDAAEWVKSHVAAVEAAYRAVGSIYAEAEARQLSGIRRALDAADADWARDGTLSQKAIRAVRSTEGVSAVLVGMRREAYVEDVLGELSRPVPRVDRTASWEKLQRSLASLNL